MKVRKGCFLSVQGEGNLVYSRRSEWKGSIHIEWVAIITDTIMFYIDELSPDYHILDLYAIGVKKLLLDQNSKT